METQNRFLVMDTFLKTKVGRNRFTGTGRHAGRRFTRGLSAVDYTVPGIIPTLRQPTGMVCWATVATMMISWRRQQSIPIETAMAQVGAKYAEKFRNNQGLAASEKEPFIRATGMTFRYPQSLSIAGWENLLRTCGPVWVTTDEDPSSGFAIHARIMAGIHGDGTPEGTTLDIYDPGTGTQYTERFSDFLRKYEEEVIATGKHWSGRIQIVHWPATSAAQSFSTGGYHQTYTRAFNAVDYTVPGLVNPLRQPSGMVCWATVATMMMSWKAQQSFSIEAAMQRVGDIYLRKFRNNEGLLPEEKEPFIRATGMVFKYPQNLSIAGWESLLRAAGPIWVTTDERPGRGFAIHARIMSGIQGDGTAAGTWVTIIDPGTGTQYRERFSDFLRKFEEEAIDDYSARIQIVHWPEQGSLGQSLSNERTQSWSISRDGISLIKRLEGFRANLYNDQAGHCTIGYGTLVHRGNCNGAASEQPYLNGITDAQAENLLMEKVHEFQRTVNDSVNVELNQNQYDSLVSFVYNIGSGAFRGSTLLRELNQGNYSRVPTEMRKWVKVRINGQLQDSQGLINRRIAEIELWNRPVTQ